MLGDGPDLLASTSMSDEQKEMLVLESYMKLLQEYDDFRKPKGTKDWPALTCSHLFHHHPHLESGTLAQVAHHCSNCFSGRHVLHRPQRGLVR